MSERQVAQRRSPNLEGLAPSATVAINERSNQLIADGREIFKLGLGQSPFPVPAVVVEALRNNAAQKDYLQVAGLAPLRAAVADYHARRHGVARAAEDVVIGPGSKELMFLLQLVFDADLVIPNPSWVSYAPQAQLLGRRVEWVPTKQADNWKLTADALNETLAKNPGRARLLILNYPNNPSGFTYGRAELESIARVAEAHGLLVLSDEIYGELHHEGAHVSIASMYPQGSIVSAGLSKWCGAGGWRLGTFLFPPQLQWLRASLITAASETFTSTSAPIQYAAIRAFEGGAEIDTYLRDSRRVLSGLGKFCAARLRSAGAQLEDPEGGFYIMPDFSPCAEVLAARGVSTSVQLVEQILEDTGVAFLPGSDFGRPADECSARMAYVDFDGELALAEVAQMGTEATIDETFVRRVCPRVATAMDRVVTWVSDLAVM